MLFSVEGGEFFALRRAAHYDRRPRAHAGEEMIIKRMQWLANLHHHVIGYIHHIADASHPDFFKRVPKPVRARADLHPSHYPRRVSRAKLWILHFDLNQFLDTPAAALKTGLRNSQRIAG